MAKEPDISPLAYQISPFHTDDRVRFIVQLRDTGDPSISLSVYEQYLYHKTRSHNTASSTLTQLGYLFTWAISEGIDIEKLLLKGELLSALQIRKFAYWLTCRGTSRSNEVKNLSISVINNILTHSSNILCWFARQYGLKESQGLSAAEMELLIASQKRLFSGAKRKDFRVRCAPDLTEEEIFAIDQYLRPENRKDAAAEVVARDFLIWRLAIEFGLREGEILALRLCDCPHKGQDYFKIVRIEERGLRYRDPRKRPPRPKTLSRDLGFLFHSQIPNLLTDYSSQHRFKWIERNGRKHKQFLPGHDFVIVNHHRTPGEPLSVSGIKSIADRITENTGIPFHWHLTRHAFFNRAYAAIVDIENKDEKKAKLMDLVYWGGWADEKSLQIYINRARASRGQKALMLWQQGGNRWASLGL